MLYEASMRHKGAEKLMVWLESLLRMPMRLFLLVSEIRMGFFSRVGLSSKKKKKNTALKNISTKKENNSFCKSTKVQQLKSTKMFFVVQFFGQLLLIWLTITILPKPSMVCCFVCSK